MARQRELDSREEKVGQAQSFEMPSAGPIDRNDFRDEIEIQDIPNWDKIKTLAFMEEPVTIVVPSTGNPADEQIIQVGVNGIDQFIFRDQPITVKRKFLYNLLTCKKDSISTPEYTDTKGDRATRIDKTPGLLYQVRVLEDKNPNGRVWAQRVLASR